MAELTLRVGVDAPPERVFAAMTDWRRQSEWMLGTHVSVTGGDGRSVGTTVEAVTGVGPLSFTDSMTITEWEPPRLCRVRHTGKIVRGDGIFAVDPRSGGGSTLVWTEQLDLPLGIVGQLAWPFVRPGFAWGVRHSLRQFARFAAEYSLPHEDV